MVLDEADSNLLIDMQPGENCHSTQMRKAARCVRVRLDGPGSKSKPSLFQPFRDAQGVFHTRQVCLWHDDQT